MNRLWLAFLIGWSASAYALSGISPPIDIANTITQSAGIACDIGPNFTGTIPAAAQAAGQTRCAANYVFSLPFYADANQANWLTCGNGGATSGTALWAQDSTNLTTMPCDIHQIVDNLPNGDGSTVLAVTWRPGYTGGGLPALQQLHTQNVFPADSYTQIIGRVQTVPDVACPPCEDSGSYSIYWTFNNPGFEFDLNETITDDIAGGPTGGNPNGAGTTIHVYGSPGNTVDSLGQTYDLRQYATWGGRETGTTVDGAGSNAAFCTDYNGTRLGCLTTAGIPAGTVNNVVNHNITAGEYCNNSFGDVSCKLPATTQVTYLVKSVQIFVCPAWSLGTFNNCASSAITSNP
jgi:hypothetical protein